MNFKLLIEVFLAAALAQILYGFVPIYLPIPFGSSIIVGALAVAIFFILKTLLKTL